MSNAAPTHATGTCQYCGKQIYTTRVAARKAARKIHPSDRFSAYQCRAALEVEIPGLWHYGHTGAAVVKGYSYRGYRG